MSLSHSLYRYIFHGTRLNVTPKEQHILTTIGLGNPAAWASFNNGDIISEESLPVSKSHYLQLKERFISSVTTMLKNLGYFSFDGVRPPTSSLIINALKNFIFRH